MYCYTFLQCIYRDLTWTLLILGVIIPLLILIVWRKEIFNKK